MERNLVATGIIERDAVNDCLPVWSYPAVASEVESVAIDRSMLKDIASDGAKTIISHFGNQWLYQRTVMSKAKELTAVTHFFSIWVLAKDFHPELYTGLVEVLEATYQTKGSPIDVLQAYLSVFARGSIGSFKGADFNPQQSMLGGPLKESVTLFGDSFILLWVAMLLKKRIAVYSDDLPQLLAFLRCLPLLVWHRRNFDVLCPLVQLAPDQLADLETRGAYCAGFVDNGIKTGRAGELYDVLVDLPGQTLEVAEGAKADLAMGDYHKNLGSFLAKAAVNDEATVPDLVKGMAAKTAQLFNKLDVLKQAGALNLAALEAQEGVSRNFARFLYNVAVTENMTEG